MSALRAGAELLYLCTALEATGPIKSYSPELMVSEVYSWSKMSSDDPSAVAAEQRRMHEKMMDLLPRFHAMTIGPGLGRDARVLEAVKMTILSCKERQTKGVKDPVPLIIDADGLWLIERAPEIMKGYSDAVLTPNAAELSRLAMALTGRSDADMQEVCDKLDGPILLAKGRIDKIYSPGGGPPLECAEEGAPRRPGGLGDFLSGSLATILGWAKLAGQDKRCACQAACTLVRRACRHAYEKKKRAMVAPDVLDELAATFEELCPA
jgi:ATP-dependent NAD(P)H-hydrate dehydratase